MEDKEKITLAVLGEKLDTLIRANKDEHWQIIAQTTKTNGRVTSLEELKNRIIGGIIIGNVILVPLTIWLFTQKIFK